MGIKPIFIPTFTYTWQKCLYFLSGERNALTESLEKNEDDMLLDVQTDQDVIVGCFADGEGKRAYLIANMTDPVDGLSVTAKLQFAKDAAMTLWQGGKACKAPNGNGYALHLRAGEGVFLEME